MLGIKNQKPAVSWSVGSESLHLTSFQMDNLRKACVEMTERNGFFQASLQFCYQLSPGREDVCQAEVPLVEEEPGF